MVAEICEVLYRQKACFVLGYDCGKEFLSALRAGEQFSPGDWWLR